MITSELSDLLNGDDTLPNSSPGLHLFPTFSDGVKLAERDKNLGDEVGQLR